jgi:cytoskeletal protein RodZ
MKIKWNQYTWYSRAAAIIFFIAVLPVWTFYMGIQYQKTADSLENATSTLEDNTVIILNDKPNATTTATTTSTSTPSIPNSTSTVSVPPEGQVFCTQDVKLCPDGSYVGRQPPRCEFSACPATPNI